MRDREKILVRSVPAILGGLGFLFIFFLHDPSGWVAIILGALLLILQVWLGRRQK